MDKTTIQQIAAEIAAQLPYGERSWVTLLITSIAMVGAAAIAAFVGSFLKIKGKHLATKSDFDSLQKQLASNTDLVEEIKSQVSQRDWAEREWTTLRRSKLEALMDRMHECEVRLDRQRKDAIHSVPTPPERDCIVELGVLADLYFPELKNEVDTFTSNCRAQVLLLHEFAQAYQEANLSARKSVVDDFKDKWGPAYTEFLGLRDALVTASRSLLERIMNVGERPSAG